MKRQLLVAISLLVITATTRTILGQSSSGTVEWPTYGADLGNSRYLPLDQVNATNSRTLQVAWLFKADNLGRRPEFLYEVTPLMVNGMIYSTAGTRRAVVALDATTGEMKWMH